MLMLLSDASLRVSHHLGTHSLAYTPLKQILRQVYDHAVNIAVRELLEMSTQAQVPLTKEMAHTFPKDLDISK
jgi:hypothetical protein